MKTITPQKVSLTISLLMLLNTKSLHAAKPADIEIQSYFVSCPTSELATASTLMTANKLDLTALPATWKILSSPVLITALGQPAEILVTEKPSQYFAKQSDGCYQLRQMRPQDGAGVTLSIKTASGSNEQVVKLDAKVEFSSIVKREELPDVSLDVGMPIIAKKTRQLALETGFGSWVLSNLSGSPFPGPQNTDQTALLLLRVRRVDSTGVPIDAHGQPLPR